MSNINFQHWKINRRQMLKGLGATLALPLLDCMADKLTEVKRSVFLYIPNGVNTLTWQITQSGKGYELTQPLKSLEKHRNVITPISGLCHPNVIGKHHNCEKVWLTGADVPSDGSSFRNTVSVDQLIASKYLGQTRFNSLELAVEGTSLAWSLDGIQIPAERNTQQIFNMLFGVDKNSKETLHRQYSKRSSILDAVADDAKKSLNTVGREDRNKLDEYFTAVRQVEQRIEQAQKWVDVDKPKLPTEISNKLQRKLTMTEAGEYYRLFYDLMAMALYTDSTRVITCGIGGEGSHSGIPELGILQTRHGLSHHNGDPEQLRRLTMADGFLIDQFSYFLDILLNLKESGSALLDTTQILWGSGMSYGHSHGNANLPTILAGGKLLGYKHGTHIDFNLPKIKQYDTSTAIEHYRICSRPVDSDARLSNLLLTMAQQAGSETNKFQDSIKPLSELI